MSDPKPTSGPMPTYRPDTVKAAPDGRLFSPKFDRNSDPIIETIKPLIEGLNGHALEIGSGTGQQICALASSFPKLSFTPSDPDEVHRQSISAWIRFAGLPVNDPIDIDASTAWHQRIKGRLQLVISLNVIHIAPIEVALGILDGASNKISTGGHLIFYGPFREHGQHTGPGNESFDKTLKARNPDWGVRDAHELAKLAKARGFSEMNMFEMPANNRILDFVKL